MKAAVYYEQNAPQRIEEIQIDRPKQGAVLVEIESGEVCHSDLLVINGNLPIHPPQRSWAMRAPGVEEISNDVTSVQPGDHVILSWRTSCRRCGYYVTGRPQLCQTEGMEFMTRFLLDGTSCLHKNGTELRHFAGVSSFAEYAVVPESGIVKIRSDVPVEAAALVGGGVMTGVGTAINTA